MKKYKIIFFLFSLFSVNCYSQDCSGSQKWGDCLKSTNVNFKIYLQPKNTAIGINDTLIYNVVFEGGRDYIVSFCADQLYYPIDIKLLESQTRKELYDNATDGYCDSIGLGIYHTQSLILEVSVLAKKIGKTKKSSEKVCVGMAIQSRKILLKTDD